MRRHTLVNEVVSGARVDERNELEAAQVDVQLQRAVLRRTHARECSDGDHRTICGERGLKSEERMQGMLSVARLPLLVVVVLVVVRDDLHSVELFASVAGNVFDVAEVTEVVLLPLIHLGRREPTTDGAPWWKRAPQAQCCRVFRCCG